MPRNSLVALLATLLGLVFAPVARADWMPTPPAPRPPDANPHAIFDPPSTTIVHMGNAEYWLSGQTFSNFVAMYGVTYNGTTAWVGSWNSRPNKPVPGEPRTMQTEVTWYRTDLMVACVYDAVVIGPDSAIAGVDGLITRIRCGPYAST